MPLDKTAIEKHIKQEIAKTKVSIDSLRLLTQPVAPDCAIGRVSRMDAIQNKSINEAALEKAIRKLSGLEFALNRIHEADFGICVRCKQAIPVQRIMLLPHSRFCARCVDI